MDIVRRSEPTKLDRAPKGTRCTVSIFPEIKDGELVGPTTFVNYIQVNRDESNPIWEFCDI